MTQMRLKCRDIPGRASLWLDREMTLRDSFAMRLHLLFCPDCRSYVAGISRMRTLAAESFRTGMPSGLAGKLGLDRVDEGGRGRS